MPIYTNRFMISFVVVVSIFSLFMILLFLGVFNQKEIIKSPTEKALKTKFAKEREGEQNLGFNLVDPGQAPEEIRKMVRLGYNIMINTTQYAAGYSGGKLNCTNCHFAGGNTTGERNAGISLVGAAATYPSYNARTKTVIDMPTRINLCFERSMNGKALPLNSREMLALVTYLQWISKGVPIYDKVPWLGLPKLESKHVAKLDGGKKVYATYCAMCHGKEGQGEIENRIPPLWGPKAFNESAGMNRKDTLASFIYYNMPYQQEQMLTEEQAIDVAAFIVSQPKPKFKN